MEHKIAASVMKLMQTYKVPPIPENYTVWYHYVQGKNTGLNAEIDKIIEQKMPFNLQVCASLHTKFFIAERNQKMIDDAAQTTQKMMADILKAVSNFSGETQSYNQELNDYIETISKSYEQEDVKEVIKDLVAATITLKKSGEQMNQRLEDSKLEIDTLRKSLQQVTVEAQRDSLTNLFNRRTFERLLEENLEAANEQKYDLCLLMLDVDHFKQFNDKHGHLLGDEVLKIVSRTLTDTLKGRDVVGRFGGEEFVVFLPNTPIEGAVKVADTIRLAIASKELKRRDTGENYGRVTVSVGVSRFRHGVDDIPKLVKRADQALYDSKRGGRNKVSREA